MKRSCFTLVELLVVMATTTLLLTVLVAAFMGVRRRARTLVCSTHIRDLALDLVMYSTSHETFPYGFKDIFNPAPPGGFLGDPSRDRMGWWWFNFMEGYADAKKKTLCCPSKSLTNSSLKDCLLYGNYGINRSICKTQDEEVRSSKGKVAWSPLSKDEIPQPSRTLLIVDCGYSITNWWHATDIPPVPLDATRGVGTAYIPGLTMNEDKRLLPGQEHDAIDGRHPDRTVNVGYVGTNVSRVHADELFVEKGIVGYSNMTPLWTPE
jgi:hypothetical protein